MYLCKQTTYNTLRTWYFFLGPSKKIYKNQQKKHNILYFTHKRT